MIYSEVVYLDGDNRVLLEVLDARSVRLTLYCREVEIQYQGRDRVSAINIGGQPYLQLPDINQVFVKIGEELHTYDIKHIVELKLLTYQLNTCKRSKVSYFIIPLVLPNRESIRWGSYFVTSYLVDYELALIYRYFSLPDYLQFEQEIKKLPNYLRTQEYDYRHTAFIFEIPPEFDPTVKLFKKGKYSNFSVKAKEKILSFHKQTKDHELGQILYKDVRKRRQLELELGEEIPEHIELFDVPNMVEEEWDPFQSR